MFQKKNPAQTAPEAHPANLSPSELVAEMETIFLDSPSEDVDIPQLMAYLTHLEQVAPVGEAFDAEASYQTFRKTHAVLLELEPDREAHRRPHRFIRVALLAAALLCVVLGISAIAYANNPAFAQWADQVFSPVDSAVTPATNPELIALRQAMEKDGFSAALLPNYLPEGYKQVDLIAFLSADNWEGLYVSGDSSILISATKKDETAISLYDSISRSAAETERTASWKTNPNAPKTYWHKHTTYYIVSNGPDSFAVWACGDIEYGIFGAPEKELYRMIDSITEK